jgi:DNA-binding NarL/FixJ family response regulator
VTTAKARLFIIDDHPLVRIGMRQILDREPDLRVAGEAPDLRTALERLQSTPVDLVLLDLSLGSGGGDGLDAIKQLRVQQADRKILVISTHDEKVYGERVIRAGALGYVMKVSPAEEMLASIRKALRGEVAVSAELGASLLNSVMLGQKPAAHAQLENLSEREREIFKLVGQGMNTREIATALGISVKTVEVHQFNLRSKLGLTSTHQLRHVAFTWAQDGTLDGLG